LGLKSGGSNSVVEDFAVPTDPALLANGILDFMVDDHETSWRFAECLGAVNGYFRIVAMFKQLFLRN
jgi:hypothetical protein